MHGMSEAMAKGAFDCPECDWAPKFDAKRPDTALRFHMDAKHAEVAV
jgi:hypothetical protein